MSAAAAPVLNVYSNESCVQCKATYRALDKKNIVYTVHDATTEESRTAYSHLGFTTAPAVLVHAPDGTILDSWGGFNPGKVAEWADRLPKKADVEAPVEEPGLRAA